MTIAAGILHSGGVLLCADTQHEAGAMKIHAPKIGHFDCPGGKIGFAFAGNSAFAISAIQKVSRKLQAASPKDTIGEIEKTLEKEYRRVVFAHPNQSTDWTLPYWLIVAYCEPDRGVSLFATQEVTVRSVVDSECIGIGRDLANYLVRPWYQPGMTESDALLLAAYMLSQVKRHVPGCGGQSQFLSIRNNGTIGFCSSINLEHIEHHSSSYDVLAHRLLFAMASVGDEAEFEMVLKEFTSRVRLMRSGWKEIESQRDSLFDVLSRMREFRKANQSTPESTICDSSSQPPSRA